MIVYDLRCADGHAFEAWFRSADAFDEQAAAHAVTCPLCGDDRIAKAPMAPFVARSGRHADATPAAVDSAANTCADVPGGAPGAAPSALGAALSPILDRLRRHIEASCVDVGPAFPEVSRRIHYGEIESHGIYGEASADEARSLREEGIEVLPLPWFQRRND